MSPALKVAAAHNSSFYVVLIFCSTDLFQPRIALSWRHAEGTSDGGWGYGSGTRTGNMRRFQAVASRPWEKRCPAAVEAGGNITAVTLKSRHFEPCQSSGFCKTLDANLRTSGPIPNCHKSLHSGNQASDFAYIAAKLRQFVCPPVLVCNAQDIGRM